MSERMYTEQDMRQIAVAAAEEVLARRPVPSSVTMAQAAEILGVSVRTVSRLKLQRNAAGRIPYEAVLEARSSR